MSGSRNRQFIILIYQDPRSVFRLKDVALLTGESDFQLLNLKLNYHVRTGKLMNPRKGIYAKPGYNSEELAGILYTPSYISLEYVLQKSGVIFQYDPGITVVSYLAREIMINENTFRYRKIKNEILLNLKGISRQENHVNIASTERAFLDLCYLESNFFFDNLSPLNRQVINELLPVYNSKVLSKRVNKLLQDG